MIKYFKGYVYVRLTGYAPERFLNLCGNRDILIWNLKPCEDGYEFCISVKGFRELKPILRKTRTKIKVLKKTGLPFGIYHYRKRKVFCGGIILFAILLYLLSGYVWNIEINGNSYLSEETILDFLKEENAAFGSKIKDLDCASLEEDLRSRYSEVIWTSIKIYGTKMTVDIQENLLPEEEYQQKDDTVYDIVAAKDGVIQEIVTRNGTPLVTAGAEVKKGDTLVSGQVEIVNDDGEVSRYLYHSADADILAEVVYPYKDEIPKEYVDKEYTGEEETEYQLRLFGITLKNPFFHKNEDSLYEIVADEQQFRFTDNFYLPVFLVKQTYKEYKNVDKTYTKEQVKALASKNLKNYIKDLEEKGIQITEKNVMIVEMKQSYVAKGTIKAKESIVSHTPTKISEITSEEGQPTDESD